LTVFVTGLHLLTSPPKNKNEKPVIFVRHPFIFLSLVGSPTDKLVEH
jgi:hypothetical protein